MPVTAASAPLRVVIAEDTVLLREGLRRVLGDAGLEVAGTAADAERLLQLTRTLQPDVVLVDIRMPPTQTTEGLQAARQIRQQWPGTAVVVLSQHVEQLYARELLAGGALGEIVTVTADHGQWFAEDRSHRLFAPELGGGALLDLGVYPVAFASMVLGKPQEIRAIVTPAFTGVDGQTSMLFRYASGAHAVLTCTLAAKSPTRAAIVGTQARIEVEGDFYAPSSFTLTTRDGEQVVSDGHQEGRGLRFEADEVARCLSEGLLESPLMALDESVEIMETMEAVLAAGAR